MCLCLCLCLYLCNEPHQWNGSTCHVTNRLNCCAVFVVSHMELHLCSSSRLKGLNKVSTSSCTPMYINIYIHVYTFIHLYIHIYICIPFMYFVQIKLNVWAFSCAPMHIHIYVCTYVRIYKCTYSHTKLYVWTFCCASWLNQGCTRCALKTLPKHLHAHPRWQLLVHLNLIKVHSH